MKSVIEVIKAIRDASCEDVAVNALVEDREAILARVKAGLWERWQRKRTKKTEMCDPVLSWDDAWGALYDVVGARAEPAQPQRKRPKVCPRARLSEGLRGLRTAAGGGLPPDVAERLGLPTESGLTDREEDS